jgi:hypothetical protein
MASIEHQLQNILSTAVADRYQSSSSTREKTASASNQYSNEESIGLIKLASILKQVEVEPSYKDLYTFIGGLYGNR